MAWLFIAELRGGGSTARPVENPLATVTASGFHHGLVVPTGGAWNDDARPPTTRTATRNAYSLLTALLRQQRYLEPDRGTDRHPYHA